MSAPHVLRLTTPEPDPRMLVAVELSGDPRAAGVVRSYLGLLVKVLGGEITPRSGRLLEVSLPLYAGPEAREQLAHAIRECPPLGGAG